MDNFVLHLMIQGYDKANELRTCVTLETSSLFEASVLEEVAVHTMEHSRLFFEELYVRATLVHHNKVVYKHDYQLI